MDKVPQPDEIWQHHKTKGEYRILYIATMQSKIVELDMQLHVVYTGMLDDKVWVRPLVDFVEILETEEGGGRLVDLLRWTGNNYRNIVV